MPPAARLVAPLVATLAFGLSACMTPPEPEIVADTDPHIANGRALARQHCSSCHAIGASDQSRMRDAIPFRDLSDLYPVEGLAEALVEGLMTGHPDMPEFKFSTPAANDFIAYLDSIQTN